MNNNRSSSTRQQQQQQQQLKKEGDKACSCGRYYGLADEQQQQEEQKQKQQQQLRLDTSFVHLSSSESPSPFQDNNKQQIIDEQAYNNISPSSSYLGTYKHLEHLLDAATNDPDLLLCETCIERVQRALDADTERLENECIMYEKTTREEEERLQSLRKAVGSGVAVAAGAGGNLGTTKRAYMDEIHALRDACESHKAEFRHLQSLQKEQMVVAKELDELQYSLEDQRNALELHARAFNNDQEQLHQALEQIQHEVDQLSSHIQLPTILLDLQVDTQRGLRYPLINELRLAYRPKGDISSHEIQVAWSLAAQLLLYIGTLFQFQSPNWKIVPLTDCAKLIFYQDESSGTTNTNNKPSKTSSSSRQAQQQQQQQQQQTRRRAVVYQLGHPQGNNTSKALLAWNALLHQVILHATKKQRDSIDKGIVVTSTSSPSSLEPGTQSGGQPKSNARLSTSNHHNCTDTPTLNGNPFPELPYPISSTTIGAIRLSELDDTDDVHWSRAIHLMASNLLWLSECASLYTSQRVLSSTLSTIVQKAL